MIDQEAHKGTIAHIKDRMGEMKEVRQPHEEMWKLISAYVLPRRNFDLPQTRGALRKRTLVDTTAVQACDRLAALLHGFMMSPYQPWLDVGLDIGELRDGAEADWGENVTRSMFRYLSDANSTFRAQSHESILDDVAFANSAIWSGTNGPGTKPYYRAMQLRESYWDEGYDGRVNTFYREFEIPLRQAVKQYPTPKLMKKMAKESANGREPVTIIHATEPRDGGRLDAVNTAKPFASIVYIETTNEIARESGYNSFPYAVTRLQRRTGDIYGVGISWNVLPLIVLLNVMVESLQRRGELENDPPIVDVAGVLSRLDRRPGAVNQLRSADLGLTDPKDILQPILPHGSAAITGELIADVRRQIQEAYFVDWQSLGSGQYVTAEFVHDRRDLRLRSMSPIVSRAEQEKLAAIGDRTFELMQSSNLLPAPPASLDGKDIAITYTSPLALAQKQSELETAARTLTLTAQAAELDPEAADEVNVPAVLRDAVLAGGSPRKHLRTKKEIEAIRANRNAREADAENTEIAEGAARAARDGSQAMQTIGDMAL